MNRSMLAVLGVLTVVTGPGAAAAQTAPAARAVPETPAPAGPLDLTRRIVRGVEEAGEDVAGYVRIRNSSPAPDRLLRVACACADRVELHRIQRDGATPGMISDPSWTVPGGGTLEVRPGSDLHLMLINYDPARASGGKVRLTLEFEYSGLIEADFALTDDSRAAWDRFGS